MKRKVKNHSLQREQRVWRPCGRTHLSVSKKTKKKMVIDPIEQGKGQDCKGRTILWRAVKAEVRHLDLILSILKANERKN